MKVLITGSSGLIGLALSEFLVSNGHQVVCLPRKDVADGSPFWNPERGIIDLANVKDIGAVVHLSGDNIAAGRWTEQKKARIRDSRVMGTKLLADYFAASDNKPRVIVSGSAIGIYGNRGDEWVDEDSEPGNSFLSEVCEQWEGATASAVHAGVRVVQVRFGMVLSRKGGALKKMMLPFRLGLGGLVGNGKQYMSWVSIDDVTHMIQHVLENASLRGPVNLVSPNPVSNREFTKTLGNVLHCPTLFPMPAFAARLLFGEMADELLLSSIRVTPRKLIDSGYVFCHPELRDALEHQLQGRKGF